jgi:hypothetical protein
MAATVSEIMDGSLYVIYRQTTHSGGGDITTTNKGDKTDMMTTGKGIFLGMK